MDSAAIRDAADKTSRTGASGYAGDYAWQPYGPYGPTYWPVHNRDFRAWRDKHNMGGDMRLFSDYRTLQRPLLPVYQAWLLVDFSPAARLPPTPCFARRGPLATFVSRLPACLP